MIKDLDKSLEDLKASPNHQRIEEVTTEFLQHENDLKTQIQLTNVYLQHIVPVYSSLRVPLKLKVRRLFHSSLGISNVLHQYKLTKNDVYFLFMKDLLLDQTLLVSAIKSCKGNKTELNQVKSLFFGSKIFQTFEGSFFLEKYLSILVIQLVEACKARVSCPDYFLNFLTIHPIEAKFTLFDTFLTETSFPYLQDSYRSMSTLQKRKLMVSYLFPYLAQYCTTSNQSTVASVIKALGISHFEDSALTRAAEISSTDFLQALAFIVLEKTQQTEKLLGLWGSEAYIKDTPSSQQEQLTKLILILLDYLTKEERKQIAKAKAFLSSITTRLSSNDPAMRSLGMMVAKSATDGEIEFSIEDEIVITRRDIQITPSIDFDQLKLSSSFKNLSIDSQKETIQLYDSERDSDDEDYDDEEEAPPVFIKDLLTRFNDEKISSVTKLLAQTIRLVRQKASFKMEIEFYSEELISVLAGLLNKYDEDKFEELKLNAIVSVIVVSPGIINKVMALLFTGDYSIQQRMMILSSVSLAARELRGVEDSFIEKPEFSFPTNEIPNRRKHFIEETTTPKITEIKDDESEHVGKGTITRMSKKLTSPKAPTKPNNFAKVAPKFFYPLANAWIEGINMGAYNEMFIKHYLQTMELIVQAAYPCYGFEEMANMFMEIKQNSSNIKI